MPDKTKKTPKRGKWTRRWGYVLEAKPVRPGVYRLEDGGFLLRGKVSIPGTKKRPEVMKIVRDVTIAAAQRVLDELLDELRARAQSQAAATETPSAAMRWSAFAALLFEEKEQRGSHESAATRELWEGTLRLYLIPAFGNLRVGEMRRSHIESWLGDVAGWLKEGRPSTKAGGKRVRVGARAANGWLRILRTITGAMTDRFDLSRDPFKGVEFFPEPRAYTHEKPNRVVTEDIPRAIAIIKDRFPALYASIVLGFLLGIRPSHIRPLRREGPQSDVKWNEGVLLVRRSSARAGTIMDRTKTHKDQEVALPAGMVDILRAHADALPEGKMRDSELLFPAEDGGLRPRGELAEPFRAISATLGYEVTPRAMRRTFNNAARAAGVHDVVTRSISGHQTEEMQRHYSHAEQDEQRGALGRLLEVMAPKIA